MTNLYNQSLEATAKSRRAYFLQIYERGGITQAELAKQAKVSRQRMQWMLKKAKEEKEGSQ